MNCVAPRAFDLWYPGFVGMKKGWCDVQVEVGTNATVVTITERDDNPGPSITNRIEVIATKIAQRILDETPLESLWFVEHYPERGSVYHLHAESWAQVHFTWSVDRIASAPKWRHLGRDGYAELRASAIPQMSDESLRRGDA